MKEKITSKDLYRLEWLGQLAVSANLNLFVRATVDRKDQHRYAYDLFANRNGKNELLIHLDKANYVWDKQHNLVYFLVQQDGKTILYQFSLTTKEIGPVADFKEKDLSLVGLKNEYLVIRVRRNFAQSEDKDWQEVTTLPFWSNDDGWVKQYREQVFLFNLKTQHKKEFMPKDFNIDEIWQHNGHFYLTGAAYQKLQPFKLGLYELDLDQAQMKELVKPDQYRIDDAAELNGKLYVIASDCKTYGINQNPNFYELDLGRHQMHLSTTWDHNYFNVVNTDCALLPGNNSCVYEHQLYFVSTIDDHCEIFAFDGQKIKPFFKWPATIDAFQFQAGELIFIGANNNELQQLYQVKDQQTRKLSNFNQFIAKDRKIAKMRRINYQDHAGNSQHGWLIYPADYEKGKKYPAILEIHGGPRTAYGTPFFHEMQVLAGQGYFVFFANIYGSEGRGNDYANMRQKYGTWDYQDLMLFTDQVLASYPQIDPRRLGVTGGSYGGFMTNWIIGHTHRFAAAVSQRSIASWITMQLSDIGLYFNPGETGSNLVASNDIKEYWRASPLQYAKNVTTPTLFLHSDHDFRCPLPEGLLMYQALMQEEVPTKMVIFHGSNHDLSRTGAPRLRVHRLDAMTAWFNHYLK